MTNGPHEDAIPSSEVADFFSGRRRATEYKHEILEKYLRIWVSKLSSRHSELAFIDTCAGAGVYGDGSDGSPLMAAKWNDRPALRENNKRLTVHAVERRRGDFESLARVLRPWTELDPPRAYVYNDRFERLLPAILDRTRDVPKLVFVDPFGISTMTADRLRPLLEHRDRAPTEVLARIDPVLFGRFAGWLADKPRDERGQRTAAAFGRLLDQLNIDSDVLSVAAAYPGRMVMMKAYLQMFEERFQWVHLIPVRESYFGAPKYFLVHCTDNPHGTAKINDAASTTDDSQFIEAELSEAGPQTLLFSPDRQPPRVRLREAEAYVLDRLGGAGSMDFVTLCAYLALRFGPDLREMHQKRVVKALVDAGRILQEPRGPLKATTRLTKIT